MENRKAIAAVVVMTVRIELVQGLRMRDRRRCSASGEASIGSRWEVNGIISDVRGSGDPREGSDLQLLEFLERGVEVPASRPPSKLLPDLAICGRDFSGVSMGPVP